MSNVSVSLGCAALALLSVCAGCRSSKDSGTKALAVSYIGPYTIATTTHTDGSVFVDEMADARLIGRKQVGLNLQAKRDMTVENVVLTYWHAGNNEGAESIEVDVNQPLAPLDAAVVMMEIPGASKLGRCDGLWYQVAVNYRVTNKSGGLYVGDPHVIMPTLKVLPDGTIDEHECDDDPLGPNHRAE